MLQGHLCHWKMVGVSDGGYKVRGKLELHWQCPQTTGNGTLCSIQMVVNIFSSIIFRVTGDQLCLSQQSEVLQSLVINGYKRVMWS